MRYEAKHSYFKGLAQSMGNFINLPYSLSMRHQQYQCYVATNDQEIIGHGLTIGPGMCSYKKSGVQLFTAFVLNPCRITCPN